jgi:hypothetical protein
MSQRLSPAELLIRKNLHGALSETTLACDATDLHEVDHLADRHSNLEQVSEDKKSPPVQHGTTRYHMIQHGMVVYGSIYHMCKNGSTWIHVVRLLPDAQ